MNKFLKDISQFRIVLLICFIPLHFRSIFFDYLKNSFHSKFSFRSSFRIPIPFVSRSPISPKLELRFALQFHFKCSHASASIQLFLSFIPFSISSSKLLLVCRKVCQSLLHSLSLSRALPPSAYLHVANPIRSVFLSPSSYGNILIPCFPFPPARSAFHFPSTWHCHCNCSPGAGS